MRFARTAFRVTVMAGLAATLAACGSTGGKGGFLGIGGSKDKPAAARGSEIGVNSYLWRASLDVIEKTKIPLASADPYGGVIITDWYTDPGAPNERFKVTVYILDTRLRADALNVSVFKQVADGAGGWADAPTASQTEVDLENAILDRARRLRLASTAND